MKTNDTSICQLPAEADCSRTPCGGTYVCASDLRCRTVCQSAVDCAGGQVCVTSVCADLDELVTGTDHLPQKGPNLSADGGTDAQATAMGGAGGGSGSGGAGGSSGGAEDAADGGSGGGGGPGGAGGASGGAADAAVTGTGGTKDAPIDSGGAGGMATSDAGPPDLPAGRPADAALSPDAKASGGSGGGTPATGGSRGGAGGIVDGGTAMDGVIAPRTCTTTVPGGPVAATNWTLAGSPYCIEGDVRVSLLTIDPGVEIFVDGAFSIEVLTSLTAIGTEASPILFSVRSPSAPGNQRWKGLKFQDVPSGSNLTYAIIEYASASGLTLTNSAAPTLDHCVFRYNSTTTNGGAIIATGMLSNLTLTDCTFSENSATNNGGALSIAMGQGYSLTLTRSLFEGNIANPTNAAGDHVGGALVFSDGDTVISDCVFRGNRVNSQCSNANTCTVTAQGGAIWMGGASAAVTRSLFVSNQTYPLNQGNCSWGGSSVSQGAGLYVNAGTVTSHNNIWGCNNTTANCNLAPAGAGIYVAGGTVSVTNDTVARNSSTGLQWAAGTLNVRNSIIYANNSNGAQVGGTGATPDGGVPHTTIAYSDVQGGYAGDGNISFNPAFSGVSCEPVDLALLSGSPAIDTGDPDTALNDGCDPPGLGTARNDMGAFGGPENCGWQ